MGWKKSAGGSAQKDFHELKLLWTKIVRKKAPVATHKGIIRSRLPSPLLTPCFCNTGNKNIDKTSLLVLLVVFRSSPITVSLAA